MPMAMTPRSSSGVPSALVPVQWISTKTVSASTADRTVSAWKSGIASSSADQLPRTWSIPWNARAGNSGCSLR